MEVSFIKKEEPADYDLIEQDVYTIAIKDEPTDEWGISYDTNTLKTESAESCGGMVSNENDVNDAPKTQRFWCYECRAVFTRKSDLSEHVKQHDTISDKEMCSVCRKLFSKPFFKYHMLYFHQGPPYRCLTCGKEFKAYKSFLHHHRFLHGDKEFECDICQKRFATKGNLNGHSETHKEQKKKFRCQYCGNSFFWNNTLLRHIRNIHLKPRVKITCSLCKYDFYSLSGHKCRRLTVKPEKYLSSYDCDKCAAVFGDLFRLVMHKQQNCAKQIMYECESCARQIPSKCSLRQHFVTHHQLKSHKKPSRKPKVPNSFECDCCRQIFRFQIRCLRHEETCKLRRDYTDFSNRKNTEDFACDICGRNFKQKFGIVEHMRIMHSTVSLSGVQFETTFNCSMNRYHMRSYSCCNDNYVNGVLNPAHVVTDECKFPCRACSTNYADLYSLLRHSADHRAKAHQSLKHMERCKSCDLMFQWKSSMPEYLQSFGHSAAD